MAEQLSDAYGHPVKIGAPTDLAAAAVGTTTAGTISGTTAAGAAPTVTNVSANDARGRFDLNPVTGGGAQAAGDVATVRFVRPYPDTPGAVLITCEALTDPDDNIICVASDVTPEGFNVLANAALTTAESYRIQYVVVP